MEEWQRIYFGELFLVFGAVTLGIAFTNIETTSPLVFAGAIFFILVAAFLKAR